MMGASASTCIQGKREDECTIMKFSLNSQRSSEEDARYSLRRRVIVSPAVAEYTGHPPRKGEECP
jgi:hypothetical protein